MQFEDGEFAHHIRIRRARLLYGHGELRAARDLLAHVPGCRARLIEAACALEVGNVEEATRLRGLAMPAASEGRDDAALAAEAALIDLRLAAGRYDVEGACRTFAQMRASYDLRCRDAEVTEIVLEGALRLAEFLLDSGRLDDGTRILERAERIEQRLPACSPILAARFAAVRAQHAIQCRQAADVPDVLAHAISLAVDAQAPFVATTAALAMANHCLQRDDVHGILAYTDMVFALATTQADPSCLFALCVRAQARAIAKDHAAAENELRLAYALVDGGPKAGNVTLAHAAILLKAQEFAKAYELLERCAAEMQPLGVHPLLGALKVAESIALSALDRSTLAARTISDAVDMLESCTDVYLLAASYRWDQKLTGRVHELPQVRPRQRVAGSRRLTQRQHDVARLLSAGASYRAIASTLNISEKTVGHHAQAIFTRLNIRARWQLADALSPHRTSNGQDRTIAANIS